MLTLTGSYLQHEQKVPVEHLDSDLLLNKYSTSSVMVNVVFEYSLVGIDNEWFLYDVLLSFVLLDWNVSY